MSRDAIYKTIIISKHKYQLYERYNSMEEAYRIAKQKRKRNKTKYFILKQEKGYPIPTTNYYLYLSNKTIKLW